MRGLQQKTFWPEPRNLQIILEKSIKQSESLHLNHVRRQLWTEGSVSGYFMPKEKAELLDPGWRECAARLFGNQVPSKDNQTAATAIPGSSHAQY